MAKEIQKPNVKEEVQNLDAAADAAFDEGMKNVNLKEDPKANSKLTKVEKKAKGIKLKPIDVIATDKGYYPVNGVNKRIKEGYKFTLEDETDFSHNWMKKI